MIYSNVFKNLDRRTIAVTKKLADDGIWKKDKTIDDLLEICQNWLNEVSEIYGIETPKLKFDKSEQLYNQTGGGVYNNIKKEIILYKKFSLVTLLHEFRHHMQYNKEINIYKKNLEEDARAWSTSLFKSSLPRSFKNAVEKGILHFH